MSRVLFPNRLRTGRLRDAYMAKGAQNGGAAEVGYALPTRGSSFPQTRKKNRCSSGYFWNIFPPSGHTQVLQIVPSWLGMLIGEG